MNIVGNRNLRDLLEERANLYPEREFLLFESLAGAMERYTYREFNERTNQLSNGLLASGFALDSKVVLHLPNSTAFLLTWFALAKIGAVMVPTNSANTEVEMEYIIQFSDAAAIVTDVARLPIVKKAMARCGSSARLFVVGAGELPSGVCAWDALWQGQPVELPAFRFSNDAIVEILFTSGTTAQPKGVEITHALCLWSGEQTAKIFNLAPGERTLTALPLFHVNAQSLSVLATLTAGATLVLLEGFSATQFWSQVRKYRANVVSLVSALLRTMLLQPERKDDLENNVRLVCYAINCTDQEKREFERRFGVELANGYGLSEAMVLVTYTPIVGPRRWPSVGLPALDREVKIVDAEGREVPSGVIGEITVHGTPGRTIFKGYYKNPEATRATVVDGWLHTGDQGWMDEAGYVHFFDRNKDVIKRGGENISASEVESTLMNLPGVRECSVIAVPDAIKDEAVMAFIVLQPGTKLSADEVKSYCAGELAKFKVPQFVEFRDSLPKTSIGKIAKQLLREELAKAGVSGSSSQKASDDAS